MTELVKADGPACITCAARTPTQQGPFCEVWKLGSSNNYQRRDRRFVFGRIQKSGTTMRPMFCPHPEHTVSTKPSPEALLRKLIK